jgi:hypothetical protein
MRTESMFLSTNKPNFAKDDILTNSPNYSASVEAIYHTAGWLTKHWAVEIQHHYDSRAHK